VAEQGEGGQVIEQGPLSGATPLLPIQQAFFATAIPERHHWNQSVLLKPAAALDAGAWSRRCRRWWRTTTACAWALPRPRPAGRPATAPWARCSRCCGSARWPMPPRCKPRPRRPSAAWTWRRAAAAGGAGDLADGSQRLLLVIHHLAVDGVSWRILFEDLQQAYEQLSRGQPLACRQDQLAATGRGTAGYAQGQAAELDSGKATHGAHEPAVPAPRRRRATGRRTCQRLDAELTRSCCKRPRRPTAPRSTTCC
jgi:hypothetical protein